MAPDGTEALHHPSEPPAGKEAGGPKDSKPPAVARSTVPRRLTWSLTAVSASRAILRPTMASTVRTALALLALSLLLAACGNGGDSIRVFAASSLRAPLTECSAGFEAVEVKLSFAGSDALAARILQGIRPDVFLSADESLPRTLAEEGVMRTPIAVAANELAVAVPADSKIRVLSGLTREGVRVAIGSDTVPIGIYARRLLADLGGIGESIAENVRSTEPDVTGIVGKLNQGAVDAGFIYLTDVLAAPDRLRSLPLPERMRPRVRYSAAVAPDAPEAAGAFVQDLRSGACAQALRAAGFLAP